MDASDRINALVERVGDLENLADHIKDVVERALRNYLEEFEDIAGELEELADEGPGEDDDAGDREELPEEVRDACRDLANGLRDLATDDAIDDMASRASDFSIDVDGLRRRWNTLSDIASML
jgi:hypothetical protein